MILKEFKRQLKRKEINPQPYAKDEFFPPVIINFFKLEKRVCRSDAASKFLEIYLFAYNYIYNSPTTA